MLVQRDKQILRFIEQYGGITINQCAKMFFNNTKHGYDLARKRLKKIRDMVDLKYITNKTTNERVYCTETKLTSHAVYVLDVYATMIQYGCKILEFKKEPQWMNGAYRSDAFFKFEYNGEKRIMCLEVDVMHTTDMTKYEKIFASNEIQNRYNDVFPLIVVVGDVLSDYKNDDFVTVFLNYNLKGFVEKVLAI